MTNGDRIRFFSSLLNHYVGTDQEIAKEDICPYDREEMCQDYIDCFTCRLKWLREESENEHGENRETVQ